MPVTSTGPGLIRRAWGALFRRAPDPPPEKPKLPPTVVHDVAMGVPPGMTMKRARRPQTIQKPVVLEYQSRQFRAGFLEPEYNLGEIMKAMDTESYLRMSFDKHEELILKNGWTIVSKNEKVLEHVYRRLTEISWSQNEPIESVIESGVESLVEMSNVFYVFARKEDQDVPTYESRFGRQMYPISGIFSADPHSMRPFIKVSKRGIREIKSWHQMVGGRIIKKFPPRNVVHMAFRKKKGFVYGTPFVTPVLDDILALRRIEELTEVAVHKHSFPFFHYKVGTDQMPARVRDDNTSEVDDIRAEINAMPADGGLVTDHRHEIVVLGVKNKAMNIEPYLKHFEARVISGVNLSGIDMGRGETANRATAQTMSKGLSDRCTRIVGFFCWQFNFWILDELVLEMGIDPTPDNRAYLVFPPIDTEEARAKENHALAMYQGSLLSETEARTRMGMDPVRPAQRKDMVFARVSKPLAIIKAVDEPYTAESKAAMGSQAATANREQPENQSKKLTSKPTVAQNSLISAEALFETFRDDMLSTLEGVDHFMDSLRDEMAEQVTVLLNDGKDAYIEESATKRELYVGSNVQGAFLKKILEPRMERLRDLMNRGMSSMQSQLDRSAMLDTLWGEVSAAVSEVSWLAGNFGYARMAQVDKHKHVRLELTSSACDDCKQQAEDPVLISSLNRGELCSHRDCISRVRLDKPPETS